MFDPSGETRRVTIFSGHYGAGKTNVAVNYAMALAARGKKTLIADLDIVNPFFRTKDSEADLKAAGVDLVALRYANSNVDLPALPAEAYRITQDKSTFSVVDLGGDDRGAYALGRYRDALTAEGDYRFVYVVNALRPITAEPADALSILREIEAAAGFRFTDLVNNTNLGPETTPEILLESASYMEELSALSGLPVWFTAAEERTAAALSGEREAMESEASAEGSIARSSAAKTGDMTGNRVFPMKLIRGVV